MSRPLALLVSLVLTASAAAQTPRALTDDSVPRPDRPVALAADLALERSAAAAVDSIKVLERQVRALQGTIDSLAASNAESLAEQVSTVHRRIDALDALNALEAQQELLQERARYLTSVKVLVELVEEGEDLSFHTEVQSAFADFRDRIDPLQDPAVQAVLRPSDDKDEDDWPTLSAVSSVLKNPIVSVVVGVARIFSGGRDRDVRAHDLSRVACAVDLATRVDTEGRVARSLLDEAGRRLRSVEGDARRELERHLLIVGYEVPPTTLASEEEGAPAPAPPGLVESYLVDRRDTPGGADDPVEAYLDARLDTKSVRSARLRAGETVRLAERYNDALAVYSDYLGAYADLVASAAAQPCSGSVIGDRGAVYPLVPSARAADLAAVAETSGALLGKFERAYTPVSSERLLQIQDPRLARAE